jgi:choline dehydrogenase-like flavoprotein
MRSLALKRSTAPSNGMNAKPAAGVPLSSPAAAQRCAEGAGLDSGASAAAQSAMPSIALPAAARTADDFDQGRHTHGASASSLGISTSLTDVTEEDIRARAATFFHPSGTCRMGSDPATVVDPRLRVIGLQGLRVADASIMPAALNACTHSPTIMIGEKAAGMIAHDSR